MTTAFSEVAALDQKYIYPTYARSSVAFIHGDGMVLYDDQGKRYLDFLAGIAVNALGHRHPRIMAALADQAGKVLHVSNLFHNEHQSRLAKSLCELSGMDRVFFCNSGTEANEAALKLARNHAYRAQGGKTNGKYEIVALSNSFHGRTVGALSATGQEKFRIPFAPLMPGVRFITPNDTEALHLAVNEHTCAVIIEPIQGESGIRMMHEDFLRAARAACDDYHALLIFDEVQCGLGRTGNYFAFQGAGVRPDLMTLAKPLGLGIPMGALLGTEATRDDFSTGTHGSTFGGGPLASRLSLEFLSVLKEEDLLDHITRMGGYFLEGLQQLQRRFPFVTEVRGKGLMLGMELEFPCKEVVRSMLDRGFVINCAHEKVLRFLPPYLVQKEHIDSLLSVLGEILAAI